MARDIAAIQIGSDFINFAWTIGRASDEYQISYRRVNDQNPREEIQSTKENHWSIQNLLVGMEYEINVRRKHNNILSTDSKVILVTIIPPPSQVSFSGETDTSITVSWQPSKS